MKVNKVNPVPPVVKIPRTRTKLGITVEGIDLTTYRGKEDPHHAVGRTSRSVSEAFKDATYACAIERHRGDWYEAVRWFSDFFMTLFVGGCAIALPVLFVLWLTK
jgi:hypothetical protein